MVQLKGGVMDAQQGSCSVTGCDGAAEFVINRRSGSYRPLSRTEIALPPDLVLVCVGHLAQFVRWQRVSKEARDAATPGRDAPAVRAAGS